MVDLLRKIVSGKKFRYTGEGYDLDLTYITDRIIAMAFPGQGLESFYRNHIDDVANFLNAKHGQNYIILNLSEKTYDYKKFANKVYDFGWEDHQTPTLDLLFKACQTIHEFILKDKNNVVIFHCKAGKGRTGTLIACYLLYCGRFSDYQEALLYYKKRRFKTGGGVTQPSQKRYVKYFAETLQRFKMEHVIIYPSVVRVDKLVLHGIPRISLEYFRPFVEVYTVRKRTLQYTTQHPEIPVPKIPIREYGKGEEVSLFFTADVPLILAGDFLVKVKHLSSMGAKPVCKFAVNTSFLEPLSDDKAILRLSSIEEIDPFEIKDDTRYPVHFSLELHMTVLHLNKGFKDPLYPRILQQHKNEGSHWDAVFQILKNHELPSQNEASVYLFGETERDNVEETLNLPVSEVNGDQTIEKIDERVHIPKKREDQMSTGMNTHESHGGTSLENENVLKASDI